MVEDISKKTVLVLVILAIVVSVLGTLTVFSAVQQHNSDYASEYSEYMTNPETSGHVSLNIGSSSAPVTTGQVTLAIVKG